MDTKTQPEAPARKFNTVTEIFEDLNFKKYLKEEISRYRKARKPGMRYKRSAFDTLTEAGQFNARYLTQQFPAIVVRQSPLPSSTRTLIENVVNEAIRKTFKFYNFSL